MGGTNQNNPPTREAKPTKQTTKLKKRTNNPLYHKTKKNKEKDKESQKSSRKDNQYSNITFSNITFSKSTPRSQREMPKEREYDDLEFNLQSSRQANLVAYHHYLLSYIPLYPLTSFCCLLGSIPLPLNWKYHLKISHQPL